MKLFLPAVPLLLAAVPALAADKPRVDKLDATPNPVKQGEHFKLTFTVADPAGGEVRWKASCGLSEVRESPGSVPDRQAGSRGTSTGGPVASGSEVSVVFAARGAEPEGGTLGRRTPEDECRAEAVGGKGKSVTVRVDKPRTRP